MARINAYEPRPSGSDSAKPLPDGRGSCKSWFVDIAARVSRDLWKSASEHCLREISQYNLDMNHQELDALLQRSLADRQLTAAERKQLDAWLDEHADDENERAFVRHRAFELVRGIGEAAAIDWLEEVIKRTVKTYRLAEAIPLAAIGSKVCFSPGEDCLREIVRQFEQARKSADVCVFTITDDRISGSIEKAHRRGIAIRIVTDNDKALDAGSDIQRLIGAGVPCAIDRTEAHMHHKFAIFDNRQLLSGSFNWTRSATMTNEENLIVTDDDRLVKAFQERFEMLWQRLAGSNGTTSRDR